MKQKWIAWLAMVALMVAFVLPTSTQAATQKPIDERLGVPIVVYGSNLTEEQKQAVRTALRVGSESEVDEISVSGQDLATYIKDSNSSARMYSSAKIMRQDAGKGLTISIVTPENITQVTAEMYANAMLTAGIEDAIVEIAAPKPVTGHSALVGIYKAYEAKTGETLDMERTDVANEELSVATSIAESADVTDDQVAALLTQIKQVISEQNPATREDVQRIVEEQLSKLEVNLSEQDRELLIDLMDRIRSLDIDFSDLSTQLSDVTAKIEEKFGAILEDDGFWNSIKEFFNNMMDTVSAWFGSTENSPE